jgi:ABC-type cobalt transport system substrate-binding protein
VKKPLLACCGVLLLALGTWFGLSRISAEWSGVDETVVEKFAEEARRPAREPYINTDQGDLLLFVFLIAGTCGGFIAGYYFRELFPPKPKEAARVPGV